MADLADDHTSGSISIAERFLGELERWLSTDRSASPAALRSALLAWLREAQAQQPSMALIHQLAARALAVADAGASREDVVTQMRGHLAESCEAERRDLQLATKSAARVAAELIPAPGQWIATLSASGAVLEAVRALIDAGRTPRMFVAESRPRFEGRAMAAALAKAGAEVWLVADTALPVLLSQAAAVWIGADAVTELGVLNKIGSYMAAVTARDHGVPVWSIATRRKLIPAGTPAFTIREMPPGEIWDAPAPGVKPRNFYFEMVPHTLLRGVVVEDTVLGATEVAVSVSDRALPDELAAALPRG